MKQQVSESAACFVAEALIVPRVPPSSSSPACLRVVWDPCPPPYSSPPQFWCGSLVAPRSWPWGRRSFRLFPVSAVSFNLPLAQLSLVLNAGWAGFIGLALPDASQVLIRVAAFGANPVDTYVRQLRGTCVRTLQGTGTPLFEEFATHTQTSPGVLLASSCRWCCCGVVPVFPSSPNHRACVRECSQISLPHPTPLTLIHT
jgi:hypothetical protein